MSRKSTEVLSRRELSLDMLLPGPENILTGIPFETAESFAQKIAEERGVELIVWNAHKEDRQRKVQNVVAWYIAKGENRPYSGNRAPFSDICFITDKSSDFSTVEYKSGLRKTIRLGEYVLLIPPSESNEPLRLDDYRRPLSASEK